MLRQDILIKELNDLLTHHSIAAKNLSSINMNDQAILSENLCLKIANILFQINLKNTNIIKRNTDTIDLHDEISQTAIQVTLRRDRDKISSTIENFIKYKHYKKYNKLYIIMLSEKINGADFKKPFDTENKFDFSAKDNVFFISDILSKALEIDINELEKLVRHVKDYIEIPARSETKQSQIQYFWKSLVLLSQYIDEAIEPDFLGRYTMDIEGAYNNACTQSDTLKLLINNITLYISKETNDGLKKLLIHSHLVLDAIRVFLKYSTEWNEKRTEYWAKAEDTRITFKRVRTEVEELLRKEL
ncbi:SMEK domain-containing protein [Dickeya fangzhongdai]|uniref:SMEK domain-containing protein n=1 Tax=Dickeya fangzhongdai TaxID=1778540 RepID=UPI0006763342|nr:SMEK domain-containing protein [Dickeya fangzhongdai]